jgi:hypothetical protein
VQRTVERRGSAGERRIGVDVGAADVPHRAGAAVLLVVGVQDEQDVQRARQHRIRMIFLCRHLEEHVEKVAGVGELVVRVNVGRPTI